MARRARRIPHTRKAIGVITAAVLIVAGGVTWLVTRGSTDAQAATRSVVTVSAQTVSTTVSTTGTIEPAHEADLSFAVSGTVTGVNVSVGDKVTKGQVLATVGRSTLTSAVTVAEASLESDEESLTSAESSGTATELAAAKAQVASAKTALASAKQDLADASLRSTITGTVATVNIDKGDTVGSSSGASGASTGSSSSSSGEDIEVISTSSWVVDASVGSADLATVKKGQAATITPTDATTRANGTVRSVGIVASSSDSSGSSSGSATFPIVIAVTGSPSGFYAGGSATVSVTVAQVANVLTVPTAALHAKNGTTYVVRSVGGTDEDTDVTIGATYGSSTQITKGLSSGDKVVVTTLAPSGAPSGGTSRSSNGSSSSGSGGAGGFGGGSGGGQGGPPGGTTGGANG